MKEAVTYRGFEISLHSGATEKGKAAGGYSVRAQSDEAMAAMEKSKITRFHTETIIETSDDRASNPDMLALDHLLEMAKAEVDRLLSRQL